MCSVDRFCIFFMHLDVLKLCLKSQIGVFARLTNSYCLAALQGSENFYSAFESELARDIPVRAPPGHKSVQSRWKVGGMNSGTRVEKV